MRKKFLVTLFCICMTLSGCGRDSSDASTIKVDEPMTDTIYVDDALKDSESVKVSESSLIDSQLEIDYNIIAANPVSSEKSSITTNTTPIPYDDSDDPEAMEIVAEVEGNEDLCGIIAMVVDYTNDWQCTIYCINPETGSQRKVSHFKVYTGKQYFPDVDVASVNITGDWYYEQPFDSLVSFADDYTKLAVTKIVSRSKSEAHAGWIDQKGNFFDVTEAVGNVVHDEFKKAVYDEAVGFVNSGRDFIFYHADESGIWRYQYIVPCNNTSSETVSLFTENMEIEEWPLNDGPHSIGGIQLGCLQGDGERITDVIDENYYLYDKYDSMHTTRQIIYSSVNHKKGTYGSYELIPSEARSNWGAVASPDGTQVAFISAAHTESDQSIFVGDLNNNALENVHRINSNLPESKTIREQICYESDCPNIFCTLLDWR